jgi:hypothetical protein
MIEPRNITIIEAGASYIVPTYHVDNEGIHCSDEYPDVPGKEIAFCKGVKNDESKPRQTGVLTESLLEVCKHYLTAVNSQVPSRETSMAITKLDEALMWLNKRQVDRNLRQVNQTDKE